VAVKADEEIVEPEPPQPTKKDNKKSKKIHPLLMY